MTAYLKVVCGVLIWAVINGFIVKDASQVVAPTTLGALMSLVGIALFLPRLYSKPWPKLTDRQKHLLVGLGSAAALNNSFFYTALATNVSGANITSIVLIHYFASILSIAWIRFIPIFRERLDKTTIISVVLGVIGLVIMIGNNWFEHKLWVYLSFLSAFFYSFEIVLSRQVQYIDPYISSLTKLGFQFALMPIVGLALGHNFTVPTGQFLYIGFAGLLLFISFVLVFSGMTQVPVKHFSVIGYLDRIGAIVIDRFYWGKVFGLNIWIGGIIIIIAEIPILFSKSIPSLKTNSKKIMTP
jgi:drug/metabolite transporter (DMT)-like permease